MLFKDNKHSANVWQIDVTDNTLELWNHWDGWRKLKTIILTDREVIETLCNVVKYNQMVTEKECDELSEKWNNQNIAA